MDLWNIASVVWEILVQLHFCRNPRILCAFLWHLLRIRGNSLPAYSKMACLFCYVAPVCASWNLKQQLAAYWAHYVHCVSEIMPEVFVFFPSPDPWLLRSKSPVGNPQLIQFSREVIDLLKNQPSCILPISNFIPSYHHHFAKQCRVSDYGYSKLIELLEAVPHVLQVKGRRGYLFKERSVLPWLQLPQPKTQTNSNLISLRACFKMQAPSQVLRKLQISNLEEFPRGLWAFSFQCLWAGTFPVVFSGMLITRGCCNHHLLGTYQGVEGSTLHKLDISHWTRV